MSALIVGCLAASAGAMIGLLVGALLACGRSQDMEIAYRRLRCALEQLLEECDASPHAVRMPSELAESLREAMQEADSLAYPECASQSRAA